MNAVVKAEPTLPGMPEPAAPSMFELIMRAVKDPACDPAKMAQLLDLSRQVRADDAKAAYTSALVALKPLLPIIDRRGRIVIHEKGKEKIDAHVIQSTAYALWEDIDAAITPILHDHGFVLTFRCGSTGAPEHRVTVTGVLSHEQGHSEETTMTLPLDTSGSKNNVQAVGSSTSYGKRYTAGLLLNLRTKGEDDDGQTGGGAPPESDQDKETREGVNNWINKQKLIIDSATSLPALYVWLDTNASMNGLSGNMAKPDSGSALGRLKRKAFDAYADISQYYQAKVTELSKK